MKKGGTILRVNIWCLGLLEFKAVSFGVAHPEGVAGFGLSALLKANVVSLTSGTANHTQIPHSFVVLSICRDKYRHYLGSSDPPKHSLELFPPVTSRFLLVLLPTSELVLSVEGNGTLKSLSLVCHLRVCFTSTKRSRWQQRGLYMG